MTRRRLTALTAAVAAIAVLAPIQTAGAGPTAQASGEELITVLTTGKLKVKSEIRYQVVCPVDCSISAENTFVIKGPNVSSSIPAATFPANTVAEAVLTPNKTLRNVIKDDLKKSKLRVEVTAVNIQTGEIDIDEVTFKFKK